MKKYYERYWQTKDTLEDFHYKWPVIKNFVPKKQSITILDFGCGKGTITRELARMNPLSKIFCVDVSSDALKTVKKRLPKVKTHQITDGGKLPFLKDTFDFIIASDVLEHIYDTENAFIELSRVLKPGGKILISVPYNGLLKRVIIAFLYFEYVFNPYSPHIRHYTKNTLKESLAKVKIHLRKAGYYGRFYPLSNGMFVIGEKS